MHLKAEKQNISSNAFIKMLGTLARLYAQDYKQ